MIIEVTKRSLLLLLLCCNLLFQSCTSSKEMVYMNDLSTDSSLSKMIKNSKLNFQTPIQKNDLLWITVGGPTSADLVALNSGMGFAGSGAGAGAVVNQGGQQVFGYLVESDGCIKLPYIGRIKAAGLNRMELEDTLKVAFAEYTREPIVNVRFLNYRVTVIGEVNRPGTLVVPNERITILEALGMAGDLTVMGKRESVVVVREIDGEREIGRINLLSANLFMSPYYYLRTNDVVYVEPAPAKFFARERLPQFVSLAAGSLSLLAIIVSITNVK